MNEQYRQYLVRYWTSERMRLMKQIERSLQQLDHEKELSLLKDNLRGVEAFLADLREDA